MYILVVRTITKDLNEQKDGELGRTLVMQILHCKTLHFRLLWPQGLKSACEFPSQAFRLGLLVNQNKA